MKVLKTIASMIKVISTILITTALGWELCNLYLNFASNFKSMYWWVFSLERFALTAHLIEGIIAVIYAPIKQQNPIKYGIYTFFVGTIALIELFTQEGHSTQRPV